MDDLISRQAAIEALTKDKKALEHIINGMSGYEKEFERLLYQRNQVDYDIYAIEQLPPAQPEIIRCKDCKHFAGEGMYCSCDIIVQFGHFYCYHAERRQDV